MTRSERSEIIEQIDTLEEEIEEAERVIRIEDNQQAIDAAYEIIRRNQAAINRLSQYL